MQFRLLTKRLVSRRFESTRPPAVDLAYPLLADHAQGASAWCNLHQVRVSPIHTGATAPTKIHEYVPPLPRGNAAVEHCCAANLR